jgi:glycosyltransferase involved in cell wall biosynthesis
LKKILLVNTEYREYGGEDANIRDELNLLSKNFAVELINFSNKSNNLASIFSFISSNNYSSNKTLYRKISSFKPDVLYVHNTWFKANLGIFKISKKLNLPTIVKIHNYRFDCGRFFLKKNHLRGELFCSKCSMTKNDSRYINKYYKESLIKSLLLTVYSKRYFNIIKNNDIQIVCLNNFQKNYLIKLGIDKSKINILHNPIPISVTKNTFNFESSYALYAGRIDSSKGVDLLINAWLNSKMKDICLKIIGEGDLLKLLVSKHNNEKIEFLGNISNVEALKEIKNSRAVLTATKMYEGQPRLLAEASSMGIPSIFPNFGGMAEYFPSNYLLSFEQYNYKDLIEKINLLQDKKLLEDTSKLLFETSLELHSSKIQQENLSKILKKLQI